MHPNPLIHPTGAAFVSRWEPVFHLAGDAGMIGPRTGMKAVTTPYGGAEEEEVTHSMGKKKTLRDHAGDLADSLAPHVENARDKAGPVLVDVRDKAAPVLADAKDKAAPLLADAKDKAGPLVSEARGRISNDVIPAVKDALAAADAATEDVRAEAKKRGKAVAAAAKGEVDAPGKKRHRVRKVLIALGLGGIAYAVAKRIGGQQSSANWQSSYTPPPAPVPPPTGGPVTDSDDSAASDPGEAASDSAEGPHSVTTPDNPAVDEPVDTATKKTAAKKQQ